MGFEIPYQLGGIAKKYIPDFIVVLDDGMGKDNLLNLICEVKGYRGEDAKEKKNTMDAYWVPGVNNLKKFGRWGFAEFRDPLTMSDQLTNETQKEVNTVLEKLFNSNIQ